MWMIIFQSAIWCLILVTGFSLELLRVHTFQRDDALVNLVCPPSHRSMDVHARYKEQCLAICVNIATCLSVFFAEHFGQCIGCSGYYRDGVSLLNMNGTVYFKKGRECEQGWIPFADSCYYFALDERVIYSGAEELCEKLDSHVVLPNDAAEDAFIVGQLALTPGEVRTWIALRENTTDYTTSRTWYASFSPNDPVIFMNWQAGEPSLYTEHCVETFHQRKPGWNDIPCEVMKVVVCEKQ